MTDKPEKPVEPGPARSEAEQHRYAQANAEWSAWIAEHPEDDVEEVAPEADAPAEEAEEAPAPVAPPAPRPGPRPAGAMPRPAPKPAGAP